MSTAGAFTAGAFTVLFRVFSQKIWPEMFDNQLIFCFVSFTSWIHSSVKECTCVVLELAPLRGEKNFKSCPRNRFLVPLSYCRVSFQNFWQAFPSFLYGTPPPRPMTAYMPGQKHSCLWKWGRLCTASRWDDVFECFKEAPETEFRIYFLVVFQDRVLYRSRDPSSIQPVIYSSCVSVKTSDHR